MIDYEMLCQTIEDWRAGRRPSIDLSPAPAGAAHDYAEVETEHDYEGGDEDPGSYADPNQGYEGYEQGYEYEGAPSPVPSSGTSPMDVSVDDVEYEH